VTRKVTRGLDVAVKRWPQAGAGAAVVRRRLGE
jgi:hypothetical protein